MAERSLDQGQGFLVPSNQAPIGVVIQQEGQDVLHYFADEAAADAALPAKATEEALSLAGVWSDLEWDDISASLDHIRHQSSPSPPIEA